MGKPTDAAMGAFEKDLATIKDLRRDVAAARRQNTGLEADLDRARGRTVELETALRHAETERDSTMDRIVGIREQRDIAKRRAERLAAYNTRLGERVRELEEIAEWKESNPPPDGMRREIDRLRQDKYNLRFEMERALELRDMAESDLQEARKRVARLEVLNTSLTKRLASDISENAMSVLNAERERVESGQAALAGGIVEGPGVKAGIDFLNSQLPEGCEIPVPDKRLDDQLVDTAEARSLINTILDSHGERLERLEDKAGLR